MKVVFEQFGHSSLAITADTYTSVLPPVARAAAEAIAGIVPPGGQNGIGEPTRADRAAGQWWWAPWGSNPQPAD
jgi:hypothetical protein